MAKKKAASSGTSANSALIQMQRLANQTQITLQSMVNSANKLQTEYNSAEAQKARDWQSEMSKSAHQMEVEDLKAAGLNPVLSSGGSGAQSYTTSSASAQPESGASALSNVQSSQLSAIGSMESSRIQAQATKAAAAQSAAAMRAAAAQSAAAQMYAADKQYKQAVKTAKIRANADKWISQNKTVGSWSGLFDKWTRKAGISGPALTGIRKFVSAGNQKCQALINNATKYFSNTGKITASNFKLNGAGVSYVNGILKRQGIAQTQKNRNQFVKAMVFKNQGASNAYYNVLLSTHYQHANKSGNTRHRR